MANIKPIRSERDYEAALDRISELMDTEADSPEGDELDVLVDLVELYESKQVPMGYPSPIVAIEFRMEQAGLRPADLASFIGSRSKVSEVLSGKRAITMPMARALHEHLGISGGRATAGAGCRLGRSVGGHGVEPVSRQVDGKVGLDPGQARSSGTRRACHAGPDQSSRGLDVAGAALYRKNDHVRANAKMNPYALGAWCWQILARATEDRPKADYERGDRNFGLP